MATSPAAADAPDQLGMAEKWSNDSSSGSDGGNMETMSEDSGLEAGFYKIHDAVDADDLGIVEAALKKHAEILQKRAAGQVSFDDDSEADINETDEDGCTPLHTAVLNGNLPAMKLLLENGCNVNIPCAESPIVHLALSTGGIARHRDFVLPAIKLLVERGAKLTAFDRLGLSVFHLCVEYDLAECAEYLLTTEAAQVLTHQDRIGQTAVHRACITKASKTLQVLLDYNPPEGSQIAKLDVDIVDRYKKCALHLCVLHSFVDGATMLLKHNASLELRDATGKTPQELAASLGESKLECIFANKATTNDSKSNDVTKWGKTLLLSHDICSLHHTCDPIITSKRVADAERPSENVNRLTVLLNEQSGILRSKRLDSLDWKTAPRAQMVDVLRVHEATYVSKIQEFCNQLDDDEVGELDGDTSISGASFEAAMHAAGSVCEAIDRVCQGTHRNAFCAVRPPGHHAGPTGVVTNKRDPHGSYGFCLLSNAAIGAAYARNLYRHQGISKVAIVDFDVHHGNGTEECIRNLVQSTKEQKYESAMCDLVVKTKSYKPWLNESDVDNVYFASVHGFGKRDPRMNANLGAFAHQSDFYPSSGEHCGLAPPNTSSTENEKESETKKRANLLGKKDSEAYIVNYGQQTKDRLEWRASWKNHILPSLVEFNPDLIIISAGFDAHEKDEINFGYLSINENDYTWLSEELVKVANSCCEGRVVSVLEGGYKIQGKLVSPFARSVYSHVAALVETHPDSKWSLSDAEAMLEAERQAEREMEVKQMAESLARKQQGMPESDNSVTPKKRELPRRSAAASVDYTQLNAELEQERMAKKAKVDENGATPKASENEKKSE